MARSLIIDSLHGTLFVERKSPQKKILHLLVHVNLIIVHFKPYIFLSVNFNLHWVISYSLTGSHFVHEIINFYKHLNNSRFTLSTIGKAYNVLFIWAAVVILCIFILFHLNSTVLMISLQYNKWVKK